MARQWVINGRFLTQPITGVQRYARELLRSLDDVLADPDPLSENLDLRLLVPNSPLPLPSLRRIPTHVVGGSLSGHAWEQLALPFHARGGILNLCNTGPILPVRQIVCIHDLNTRTVPSSYSRAFRTLYSVLVPALARTAALVTTVSEYSANQLVHQKVCRQRPLVIPNGHEHVYRWGGRRDVLSTNRIAVIGSTAKHKNIGLLLRLAPLLARYDLRIAIIGRVQPSVFNTDGETATHPNVEWLGGLDDEELARVLRSSLCLAFPSLTEGFGLPPLEAMALGCPVVASDRASLPEVCGSAALYASPDDPTAWCEAFLALKRNPDLRGRLIAEGFTQSKRFSWHRSARLYLRAMAQLDGLLVDSSTGLSEAPVLPSPNIFGRRL